MGAALGEFQARTGDEIGDDSRNQDFVRLGLRHDASRSVNGYTADIAASHFDLACMETGPKRQTNLLGSRSKRQRASNCAAWTIESRKNAIAGSLDQIATMFIDHLLRYLIVTVQQTTPNLIAHHGGAAGRIHNVGKQNRGYKALQ